MSLSRPTEDWAVEDIDKMLELLPVIESSDFVPCTRLEQPDKPNAILLQTAVYHPAVHTMWEMLYATSAYIEPYAPLPEDPSQERIPFSVRGARFAPEYFASATLNQVRRYLVLCTRGERYCDGYIAGQFGSGSIQAALWRLRQLRDLMA